MVGKVSEGCIVNVTVLTWTTERGNKCVFFQLPLRDPTLNVLVSQKG